MTLLNYYYINSVWDIIKQDLDRDSLVRQSVSVSRLDCIHIIMFTVLCIAYASLLQSAHTH